MDAPVAGQSRPRVEWRADGTGDVVAGSVRSCLAANSCGLPFCLCTCFSDTKTKSVKQTAQVGSAAGWVVATNGVLVATNLVLGPCPMGPEA